MQHLYKAIRYSRVLISMFYVFSFSSLFCCCLRHRRRLYNQISKRKKKRSDRNKIFHCNGDWERLLHLFTIITDDQCSLRIFLIFNFLVVYNNWHEFEFSILAFVYVFALLSSKSRRERGQINFFVVCHGVCSFHANGIFGRREMKRLRGDKMDAQMW